MTKNIFFTALVALTALSATTMSAAAQVHIGSLNEPKATLEVTGKATDATLPGFMCPRLTLKQLNDARAKFSTAQVGAVVYITDETDDTPINSYSDQIGCTGFVYWNGSHWISDCPVAASWIKIASQPKAFSFYEEGTPVNGETALVFSASASSAVSYQWYKITGKNIHVRLAEPCTSSDGTGFDTGSFKPKVLKGTTKLASNCGMYTFFCVAHNLQNDSVVSNYAEVAVGCGAKNMQGEWLSFLCFNLGAQDPYLTLAQQQNGMELRNGTGFAGNTANDPDGLHYYIPDEEKIYGDLYQWGRIGDGHEKRGGTSLISANGHLPSNNEAWRIGSGAPYDTLRHNNASTNTFVGGSAYGLSYEDFESGALVNSTSQRYPTDQIKRGTSWYGKFVKTASAQDYNWAYFMLQSNKDNLWKSGSYPANDPCGKIKSTYTGLNPLATAILAQNDAQAATDDWEVYYPNYMPSGGTTGSGTGWRLPTQDEWAALYRGGTVSGSPANALANTWEWYKNDATARVPGYKIMPDGKTVTLFLPASGTRNDSNAQLYNQGTDGPYWSSTFAGTNAYRLSFNSGTVNPAGMHSRSYGFALRCTRN